MNDMNIEDAGLRQELTNIIFNAGVGGGSKVNPMSRKMRSDIITAIDKWYLSKITKPQPTQLDLFE